MSRGGTWVAVAMFWVILGTFVYLVVTVGLPWWWWLLAAVALFVACWPERRR